MESPYLQQMRMQVHTLSIRVGDCASLTVAGLAGGADICCDISPRTSRVYSTACPCLLVRSPSCHSITHHASRTSPEQELIFALANLNNKTRAARGVSDAYLPQTPPRGRSLSVSASTIGSNAVPTAPSSLMRSGSLRKPSSPSSTLASRSFGFASDRSPLQMLELELKHISKEESDTPSLGRSLSKRQEERLQRSTTISSRLTASPTSPSSSTVNTRIRDPSHHYQRHGISGSTHHRHRMSNILGTHDISRGKLKGKERASYHDRLSNAEDINKLQITHNPPPVNQTTTSDSDRVDRKTRHHRHGYQFQHVSRRTSSTSSSSKGNTARLSQAAGGERVFDGEVAHLTLEDGEFDYSGPAEDDGMANLYQEGPIPISHSHPISHTGYPSSFPSPHSSQLRKPLKVPAPEDLSLNDSPGHVAVESTTDGHFSASEPKTTHSVGQTSSPIIPSRSSADMVSTRVSQTKEEMRNELIMSFIRAIPRRQAAAPTSFFPALNIKCGPLLRYTGLRRDGDSSKGSTAKQERETWRGSVLVVTTDDMSDYSPLPVIRLFFQSESDVAGTNTGATILKPTEPRRGGASWGLPGRVDTFSDEHPPSDVQAIRKIKDGEKLGKYRELEATKLHAERGVTFWRFIIEVELSDQQTRIAYRINHGPSIAFWVPARGETMNIMFHSCNGFSLSVNPDDFCGPDPLWRDVLREHQKKPFHVMLGGGDQIYNDAISKKTTLFREWLAIKTPFQKSNHPFSTEMADELEDFYLERYCMWFSQGLFGVANAQIPMVNIWDDHDIIDGFGSYPHHFNRCAVFTGLGAVAFKYYLLFQHQSIVDEKEEHEPSWLLGATPGPYITELSRSCFMSLGRKVAFLGLDCRTERMRDLVLSKKSYDRVFDRLQKEVVRGETKHLIVLLGVPIAYPRLVWLENLMTSKLMDPFKALGRMGYLGGFINTFDGGVELLDDLDDHWTARSHKSERNWFIKNLQAFAAEKSVRITILGGDVHLAGIGQFYSNPKLNILRENDHRYMPNIISSAIVNTPPPNALADVLNKRNKVHHLDYETDEDMYPIFTTDVDGKPRNNKRLLPRRNYAVIREYVENETLSPSETEPVKRSTFSKIRRNTFKRSQKADLTPNKTVAGLDGANLSTGQNDHQREALDVVLKMEVNQHDPSGATKPYRLVVPALKCERAAADGDSWSHDGGWI